ncbi:hypothetical protein GCM10023185_14360 [Hymenobacter saemangeumensis]|uniref:Aerotolerance regulator N-terminal domain-containing protein n=1 Tax=Hymenobacter saemangeumensis TaxID=1084522 RepID=A0ABP8I8S9_9BACT
MSLGQAAAHSRTWTNPCSFSAPFALLTFLTPSALLALLGLLVPVAIHLWNRRPGREVAVGSLRWLTAGANRRLRSLQPEQLWLLLVRAALLAVLALALAGPVWRQARPAPRGQVLLSPDIATNPALALHRPRIDSLRQRGYTLRWLSAGFPKISGPAWQASSRVLGDSARGLLAAERGVPRYQWARVQQAAGKFGSQPLLVLGSTAQRGLQGSHPPLPGTISWVALPHTGRSRWVQAAALRADSLALWLGSSTEAQTSFRRYAVSKPAAGAPIRLPGLPAHQLTEGAQGRLLTSLPTAGPARETIPVTDRPLRATIFYTDEYSADARVLQAGLRAAALGLRVPLALRLTSSAPAPAAAPDWLFWLSDDPLPAEWRRALGQGTRLWQEAPAPGAANLSHLQHRLVQEKPTAIFRRAVAAPTGQPLWTDGPGRAVLSRTAVDQGAIYQLHTRLHPAWSELADSPALPALLLELLHPEPAPDIASDSLDQRAIDPAQLAGPTRPAARSNPQRVFHTIDLRPWLVLAAGLLFAFERLLAQRRARLSPTTL